MLGMIETQPITPQPISSQQTIPINTLFGTAPTVSDDDNPSPAVAEAQALEEEDGSVYASDTVSTVEGPHMDLLTLKPSSISNTMVVKHSSTAGSMV